MDWRSILLLITGILSSDLSIAQDSLLLQTLRDNRYDMQLEGGKLSGPGAELLREAALANQFMLIGEDHGTVEIPQFTGALYEHIQEAGYRYFATETGPYTAAMLQKLALHDDFPGNLVDTLKKYPWSIPFYNWREEAEMLQRILGQRQPDEPVIWGLDQEFAGSPRLHLQHLRAMTTHAEARSLLSDYAGRAMKGFEQTISTRNPTAMFMYSVSREDFAGLRNALGDHADAHGLLGELEESWEIYHQYFTGQGYASNQQRAELMKRHFRTYYWQARSGGQLPKVLFKFGANHIYRGANGLNVFDIGNFVNELASLEGTGSFHLYLVGRKGTQNAYNPFTDESAKKQAYDAQNYLDHLDIGPMLESGAAGSWNIFDLRPLRHLLFNRSIREVDAAFEKVIWSYDVMVLIPEVHAAHNLDDE